MIKLLFVCLGNICRSPTAHGVMVQRIAARGLQSKIIIDSAGTGDWHIGSPPDSRASSAAARRGYELSHLRARQVTGRDFDEFDLILAMDRQNKQDLLALADPKHHVKVRLLLESTPDCGFRDVPDPYYGGVDGFDHVLDLVEAACDELLAEIIDQYALSQ